MPQLTPFTASTLAVAAILLLPGCTGDAPLVLPSPESSTAPVFASDEEALAAAEAAYGEYLRLLDEIFSDGGVGGDRLNAVAAAELVERQAVGFEEAMAAGETSFGTTTFDSMELQQYDSGAPGGDSIVTVYVCQDVSQVDVRDKQGNSVVADGRATRIPFEVAFDLSSTQSKLIVGSTEIWTGADFCND